MSDVKVEVKLTEEEKEAVSDVKVEVKLTEEEKEAALQSAYIKLKVIDTVGEEVHFRVKMTTKLGRLKKTYSERVGAQLTGLRFLFDGKRINDDETPKILEMEDGDCIDVYKEQIGGSR